MRRRTFLAGTATTAATALAGCMGGGSTGTLATKVSDQPGDIGDFETLIIHVTTVYVKPTDGERKSFDVDQTVDLTKLTGENTALVGEQELATGEYEFLQLQAEATEAKLKSGGSADVSTPGEAPLKFNKNFEIRANQTTTFVADFTPVQQGQTNRYVLQPVADEVKVIYEGEGGSGNQTNSS
ncbi:DUF4382 domain-containing protein [Halospeciosus flavus]|uniref:DUF4382 domain-containing protein n=1 Tax=Halospeciosus flavus TaxID=3032283 RepID=A0ABD5Z449_9EURY|nr:DUF4382 domain-containing protein [Halospeciosus flavus]